MGRRFGIPVNQYCAGRKNGGGRLNMDASAQLSLNRFDLEVKKPSSEISQPIAISVSVFRIWGGAVDLAQRMREISNF